MTVESHPIVEQMAYIVRKKVLTVQRTKDIDPFSFMSLSIQGNWATKNADDTGLAHT